VAATYRAAVAFATTHILGDIRFVLRAIASGVRAITRAGDIGFEPVLGPLIGRPQLVGRGFRLVRDLLGEPAAASYERSVAPSMIV
jgi:hypothetical protein